MILGMWWPSDGGHHPDTKTPADAMASATFLCHSEEKFKVPNDMWATDIVTTSTLGGCDLEMI